MYNNLLTKNVIGEAYNELNKYLLSEYDKVQFITILMKIEFNGSVRSISRSQTVQIENNDLLISIFQEYFDIKDEDYKNILITNIIFTYFIHPLEKNIIERVEKVRTNNKILEKGMGFSFSGYKLPSTMDFMEWGYCIFLNDYKKAIVYKDNSEFKYEITLFDNYIEVKLKNNEIVILSWKDYMRDGANLNSFTRIIENEHEYIFENGELILKKITRKTKFLTTLKPSLYRRTEIITMDLETREFELVKNEESKYEVICVSIYDGKEIKSFHISDFNNKDEMLKSSIKFLMKRKYSGYKVYLHNFSYFDGIFLMSSLADLSDKLTPIIRDGRIINLRFDFGNYVLYFRDSMLLLPVSLEKLANSFKVENKGIFPYDFLNVFLSNNTNGNYIGTVPPFKYFDKNKITKSQYKEYRSKFKSKKWDMNSELIKYCEQDVRTLYQVLDQFSKNIFELFRIDLLKYPTLPSLALAIFRTQFLENETIPLINGKIYEDISKGYTGGAVDVYKPYGKKIYRYDVNSLYPAVMRNNKMPIGTPVYFEGDIFKIDSNAHGFFEVEVNTPSDLNIPLLQSRFKTLDNGIRTIAPLGSWKDIFYSEEIKALMLIGYKFKILKGYLFNSDYIFIKYVDFLYNLKQNSLKGDANYIISKLLLNSLYGKFGMKPEIENHMITSEEESIEYSKKYVLSDLISLQNGKVMFSYINDKERNTNRTFNISISISAAVTAYARMHMAKFKQMKDINIYYSDTDSIDINKPLDSQFIGPELGQMKLEHIFDQAVYLSPKVYGGKTSSYEYVKVKGLKNPLSFKELKSLLIKDSKLITTQNKWYRDISKANILIKNEVYNLMVTANKRKLIYDSNNKLISTKPLLVCDGKITNKNEL